MCTRTRNICKYSSEVYCIVYLPHCHVPSFTSPSVILPPWSSFYSPYMSIILCKRTRTIRKSSSVVRCFIILTVPLRSFLSLPTVTLPSFPSSFCYPLCLLYCERKQEISVLSSLLFVVSSTYRSINIPSFPFPYSSPPTLVFILLSFHVYNSMTSARTRHQSPLPFLSLTASPPFSPLLYRHVPPFSPAPPLLPPSLVSILPSLHVSFCFVFN